jgi:osmoprotectant transport system permease protein
LSFPSYFAANWNTLGPEILSHLQIVVITVAIAALLGIGMGILAARSSRFSSGATALTSAILTVPSFALFGALAIWFGIGNLPVIIGLILYALLPVLRNTEAGIRGVDPAVVEAARGTGMTPAQVLRQIEIPLALPLIVAGLRQASVLVVAIATVGAAVGSDNLGQPILAGIRGSDRYAILSGVIPVAIVGILADVGLGSLSRALGPRENASAA